VVTRYQKRVSGPLMDRIDLHVEVPRVDFAKLVDPCPAEGSAAIRVRVEAARRRALERFAGTGLLCNADMRAGDVRRHCRLDESATVLMRTAMQQMQLSARAFHRVLKIARTIADLAGAEQIASAHLAEALQYRPRRAV
jgi:magnesium chelatase family protein